jgi:hypothetical protein
MKKELEILEVDVVVPWEGSAQPIDNNGSDDGS